MQKIIAALDGFRPSEGTMDYSIHLAGQSGSQLVGVFLDDNTYHTYSLNDVIHEKGGIFESKRKKLDKKEAKLRAIAVKNFEAACIKEGIKYILHHDRQIALKELQHESIFADLLILDKHETLSKHPGSHLPTLFIRRLLRAVKSPVLLVPRKFKPLTRLYFLYNGQASSVHAIKMFNYIFGNNLNVPVEVITVKNKIENNHVPDMSLMKEFMSRHFPAASYTVLKGEPETTLIDYIEKKGGNPWIILGAYRRSRLSQWMRPSLADWLMTETDFPLFIAP